ncbi:MAG: hypothetical protein ACYTA3_06025 [Planctomycetota bacterium]|jgi:hypothetical protein
MRKPGTDESNVQMSDVLCDFCHREWTEDVPMIEGHQGSCLCGRCLTVAYTEVVVNGHDTAPASYTEDAVICRRCIELAARSLEKDRDSGWKKPDNSHKSDVTA